MRKARVFISCGQSTDREKNIGLAVEAYFKNERRFETYFAERVHSSDALTENIFSFLSQSEYFIFIDFKRDSIGGNDYRGSLFVNQEIAIATFLKLQSGITTAFNCEFSNGIHLLREGGKPENCKK